MWIMILFYNSFFLSSPLLSGLCLQCYQCGTYVKERPVLLGSTENHDLYDPPVPKCNHFNASLPIFWVTCQPHEKGCLKGWLTQPKSPKLDNGVVRTCTVIQDNVCLIQGAGGACSCSSDFCNIASNQIPKAYIPMLIYLMIIVGFS